MSNDPVDKLLDNAIQGNSLLKDRSVLQTKFEPEVILHRDAELAKVTQALLPILKGSRPSNLLIYGKPGTGKTLVVSKVLSKIEKKVQDSKFPIKFIYANAKDETTIYGLLVHLGSKLGIELPTTGLSISIVFTKIIDTIKHNSINAIFVVDEIDYLAELASKTGKDILYNLTRANERLKEGGSLTLIGISNLLTFKERLDPRVISSLSEEEVVFTNYSVDQIKQILAERIKSAFIKDAVGEAALNLCAALAGQEHGDARRAIDLLRVAGELAEREQANHVTEEHIRRAAQKMEEDKEFTALNSYPLHEKLLIVAVMRSNGAATGEVYHTYKELCKTIRQKEVTQRRATQILSDIELSGLITGKIIHQGMHGRTKKYNLTIQPETVKKAFQNDIILADIL
ncbi:MAG: AAA family ATPase [Candidatus Nitrosotenuis sp.]|uniref:ORC1-type DNA replication protein n=1 Tax=Candidatus Nitrosotenuis uzonensis TaxID=1407055 RepID=V6AVM4_9ARCH|nr:AAA family ATPase [Candidatus Nitrosotenuis uzonensis]CDI06638.1 Cell division control protein 6 homolog [Candidatus Nitrosotenuis uzonensis]